MGIKFENLKEKREKRVEQLKACAQTIIDRAEDIIGEYEFSQGYTVEISIPCKGFPQIITEKRFISEKVIDAL